MFCFISKNIFDIGLSFGSVPNRGKSISEQMAAYLPDSYIPCNKDWYRNHHNQDFILNLGTDAVGPKWIPSGQPWHHWEVTETYSTSQEVCHTSRFVVFWSWWRHQMETFSALLAICAGNSPVTGEFPAQRPVTRGLDVFFDLCLNKRLSKQCWGWWFETPSNPLWRHSNVPASWHGAILQFLQCQCSNTEEYGKIHHTNPQRLDNITTTKLVT